MNILKYLLAIGAAGVFALSATSASIASTKGSIISFNGPAGEAYIGRFIKGIKNLKETYATDTQTCARIDVIINKIIQILED